MEKTYTIKQIKDAFWTVFHESGEQWFECLQSSEVNNDNTNSCWFEFEEALQKTINE
jgi:hypothetical protein